MPQRIPSNGKWVAPVKPNTSSTGGDVLQLTATGNPQIDQVLRQMADFMLATHRQTKQDIDQHAQSISHLQANVPANLQHELSTKGSAPLNINGLIGMPAVLATVPVNNSGAATNLQGLAHSGSDPGPASLTVAKYKQFTDTDGKVYFLTLFQ